ncbi:hypothetical protein [uncultured Tateyamaria sp.]|uniref:hypothetical protein n=1 Tax=uncultured Tateyamaria sp. TaxID=455651 RepID=UPI002634ED8C|nr:hypothetical protein [uncultured Tateyamaria sp.]
MSVAIAFMFKPGHSLEWQSLVLASSVRNFLNPDVALYAFIDPSDADHMSQEHEHFFQTLRVRLRNLPDQSFFETPYPHGNKILICNQEFGEDRVIFLDSDMLFLRETSLDPVVQDPVVLTYSLGQDWGNLSQWEQVYQLFGATQADIPHIELSELRTVPAYYNAGMVSFSKDSGFGQAWLKAAQTIDRATNIENKRPWLDQVALPLTPFAGGPQISKPTERGFNVRPRRGYMEHVVLAHYTPKYLYLSGASRIANQVLFKQLGVNLQYLQCQAIVNELRIRRSRLDGRKKPFVKIYGERNTGTNLLRGVIKSNYDARVLNSANDLNSAKSQIYDALGKFKRKTKNTVVDISDSIILQNGLGWEHGAPAFDIISQSPYVGNTLFLCIYKDPYFWLKSYFKGGNNPVKLFDSNNDFGEFLSRPMGVSVRDRVVAPFDTGPLEIYQMKMRSYLRLRSIYGDDVMFVSYEDLLRNEEKFLDLLSARLQKIENAPGFPEHAVESRGQSELTTEDYRAKYRLENRTSDLSSEEIAFIEGRLDHQLWREVNWQNALYSPSMGARIKRAVRILLRRN